MKTKGGKRTEEEGERRRNGWMGTKRGGLMTGMGEIGNTGLEASGS
jgi:hypothetical protein